MSRPLTPAPLLSVPRLRLAVADTVCPAAPVTDPREILLPGNRPGLEILFVLGVAGERHSRRPVVLPGLVTGLLSCPERSSAPRAVFGRVRGAGGTGTLLRGRVVIPGGALRGRDLFGDRSHLLVGDVRVVLDGERDGEVRFVELVPEASQAAHSADARPSHGTATGPNLCRGWEEIATQNNDGENGSRGFTFRQSVALPPGWFVGSGENTVSRSPCQQRGRDEPVCLGPSLNIVLSRGL